MREPILKAVAMPPRLFFAPFALAMANFVLQMALLFILMALIDMSPLIAMGTIFLGHVFLIVEGTREPHLSRVLEAWGRSGPTMSHNIYRSRGVKLAP